MSHAVLDRTELAPSAGLNGDGGGADVGGPSSFRRRWSRWLWVLLAPIAVVALIAAIVVPQLGGGGLRAGEAELDTNGGRASVQHGDSGQVEQVTGTARLRTGDIVTAEEGQPSLTLPGGGELQLRSPADGLEASSVKIAATPEVRSGDVLATSEDHAYPLVADGTVLTVASHSVVRVSRSNATVDVGVYQGSAGIDSAGVTRTVPALRQVAVTALRNVDQAYAVPVDTADPWDRQYLAPAIDAQHLLDPLRASFDGVVGNNQLSASQLSQAIPNLPPVGALTAKLAALPTGIDPGDVLVGATIVSLGQRGSAVERWDAVFGFRDEGGATWGLVAMDQGVSPAALSQGSQDAVQRLLALLTPAAAPTPAVAAAPTPTTGAATAPAAQAPTPGRSASAPITTSSSGSGPPATASPKVTPSPSAPSANQQPLLPLPIPLPTLPPPLQQLTGPLVGTGSGNGQQGNSGAGGSPQGGSGSSGSGSGSGQTSNGGSGSSQGGSGGSIGLLDPLLHAVGGLLSWLLP